MSKDVSWEKIFHDYHIDNHNFEKEPYYISAEQIKRSCQEFKETGEKEVRLLCKQDTRQDRPKCFIERGLFLLPIKNGYYAIIQGEGYVDIPPIETTTIFYQSKMDFKLDTASVGNSEMQHLDYAYATSLIRTFMQDDSLVLTIRGRKYTPKFEFLVGKHRLEVQGVQTEVDAGYEGRDQIVLVEAKGLKATNIIIRQLYYPFRQWQEHTQKPVKTLFFQKEQNTYCLWQFEFTAHLEYNSIRLTRSARYQMIER